MTGRVVDEADIVNRTRAGTPVGDVYRWAREQAALLRTGLVEGLDTVNLADEIDDVGHAEYDKLESAMTVLMQHILKWDFQPDRRSRGWDLTIDERRARVTKRLKRNPSLRAKRDEILRDAFDSAKRRAYIETDLPRGTFPDICPWDWTEIMERPFVWDV